MATSTVAFRTAVDQRWTVPVKNTFINFDAPPAKPAACFRSATCPPLYRLGCSVTSDEITWESATQELCHCMAPRLQRAAVAPLLLSAAQESIIVTADAEQPQEVEISEASDSKSYKQDSEDPESPVAVATCAKGKKGSEAEADAISDVSTKESEGPPDSQAKGSVTQQWTNVPSKKKKTKGHSEETRPSVAAKPQSGIRGEARGEQRESAPPAENRRERPSGRGEHHYRGEPRGSELHQAATFPKSMGKGKGKGKGLPHFHRIEVGIEDDPHFRVVQRLIGPKGKHMQDIVNESPGAKVWIIGRGSRSWEDDVGPLMICVGAPTSSVFESAVRLAEDLLAQVREEHRKFR